MDAGAVHDYFSGLQERIVAALEVVDRKGFVRDSWQRPEGGGGTTCIVEDGQVFERGGVNLSRVQGSNLPPSASAARPQLAGRAFEAMGVSLVLHPRNPYCPTVHLNVRFFTAGDIWWFGGGMDLTPYYGFEEDARHFHAHVPEGAGALRRRLHPKFKRWCDEYFHLRAPQRAARHRRHLLRRSRRETSPSTWRSRSATISSRPTCRSWSAARTMPFGERERSFQAYRRGRYVEFNLVYDRGTLFGLQSGGRTESILMSLPPRAEWRYDWKPAPGSPEAKLYSDFLKSARLDLT